MPPKKAAAGKNKAQEKVKQKIVDDKTFGLKNKKGKKQQNFIKTVAHQVEGNKKNQVNEQVGKQLSKRDQEKKKLDELNELFKPVQQAQKVAAGVDPKSVLCSFFKNGSCQKGNRCKFSHDLSIERKSEKRSIYTDERDADPSKGTMSDWDQATLEDVVKKKHGATNSVKTQIVCKYFLEAVEKSLYGWFWNCPNSDKCIYKHALPAGFVLKKDKKKEEEEDKVSLEEHIENERNQLSGELTPVTIQTFLAWKSRKLKEKKEKLKKEMSQKKEAFKSGKSLTAVSGKEVFLFKPELADADDDEFDDDFSHYMREGTGVEKESCVEINLETFATNATEGAVNSKITKVSTLLAKDRETAGAPTSTSYDDYIEEEPEPADTSQTDINGLEEASGSSTTNQSNVEIDESLFENLDDLDIDDD